MKVFYKTILFIIIMVSSFSLHADNFIIFQCSWNNNKPIKIIVNPINNTAIRLDGGASYDVIKITRFAVWLEVHEPTNQSEMKIQMIQRPETVNNKAGKWTEVIFSMTGTILPIEGGLCWEQ